MNPTLTHSATVCWASLQNVGGLPAGRWVLGMDSVSGLGQDSLGKHLEGSLMWRTTYEGHFQQSD